MRTARLPTVRVVAATRCQRTPLWSMSGRWVGGYPPPDILTHSHPQKEPGTREPPPEDIRLEIHTPVDRMTDTDRRL